MSLAAFLHFIVQDYHFLKVRLFAFLSIPSSYAYPEDERWMCSEGRCKTDFLFVFAPSPPSPQQYARANSLAAYKTEDRELMQGSMQIVQECLKETEMHIKVGFLLPLFPFRPFLYLSSFAFASSTST